MAVADRFPGSLPPSELTVVGGAGLLALVVALAVVAGPPGAGAGLVVGIFGLVLPATHAVALAHVLLLPVVPGVGAVRLVVWASLLAVLVGPARRLDGGGRLAATTVVLAGGLWLGTSWLSGLAARGGALIVAGGLAAYALHRYAVVSVRVEGGEADGE